MCLMMIRYFGVCISVFLTACICKSDAARTLRFANYYGDHMVLQMAPKRAQIWGYATTTGDTVYVSLNGKNVANATVQQDRKGGSMGIWSALLPPQHSGSFVTLEIQSNDGNVTLVDVMFGDVWVCSGQSNMVFPMFHVYNQSYELGRASHFQDIRFMAVKTSRSNTTLFEPQIATTWQQPSANDYGTQHFSAVCLMYAMNIAPHIHHPIGLVQTAFGGTQIEAWSSPDAMATCNSKPRDRAVVGAVELWNAMLFPLLNMTIYGAIWYQGESNAGYYKDYMCQFPAMIDDWRKNFHEASHNQTSKTFPFGFVQHENRSARMGAQFVPIEMPSTSLYIETRENAYQSQPQPQSKNKASHTQPKAYQNRTLKVGMPDLRWSQTAGYGYVPNPRLQNVFMAVAMDLPDFASPYGSIHPRDKQDVAERLSLSGRTVAYGESNIDFQGPIPSKFTLNSDHTLTIEFDHGNSVIEIRQNEGFEVCCSNISNGTCSRHFVETRILHHNQISVTIDTSVCHGNNHFVTSVRYAWEMSPCEFKQCAIYGRDNDLPAAAFKTSLPRDMF